MGSAWYLVGTLIKRVMERQIFNFHLSVDVFIVLFVIMIIEKLPQMHLCSSVPSTVLGPAPRA